MNLGELINIVDGKVLSNSFDENETILGGCGADLMSDVLASIEPGAVLLTGLCNPQVIRTAQMADVAAVVLVRGKCPPESTIELANSEEIPLITSPFGMFELCGRLYKAGLSSLEKSVSDSPDSECG
ncbi:MAG TPA: DRTGG domain-containing protein [Anaerolineaceae bacterium]|nr:DRTGG domain-containing protein [Anaerolineaceae bacterium]